MSPGFADLLSLWDAHHLNNAQRVGVPLLALLADMLRVKPAAAAEAQGFVHLQLDGVARALCQRRMRAVYSHLTSGVRTRHNAGLTLLAAVAGRNAALAWEVFRAFDFSLKELPALASPRGAKRSKRDANGTSAGGPTSNGRSTPHATVDDIALPTRHVFVGFALALLESGDASLTRPVLAQKALFGNVLRHVASALAFAHARNVAHLDVKPDNVLVRDGVYKLADWGRAAPVDGVGYVGEPSGVGAKKQRLVSKPVSVEEGDSRYLAPELLRGDFAPFWQNADDAPREVSANEPRERSPYSFVGLDRADVFSLGATAYELASGAPLPASGEAYQALRDGRVSFESFAASPGTRGATRFSDGSRRETDARDGCFTTAFQTLVSSMVAADPGTRPCAAEVLAVLDKMDANDRGPGEDVFRGSQGVIGMFSPAVPDSTAKPSPGSSRPGLGGTPSRLGFGAGPMGGR